MTDLRYHPLQLAQLCQRTSKFPDSRQVVNESGNSVAMEIFGPLVRLDGMVETDTMIAITSILYHTLGRLHRQFKAAVAKFPQKQQKLERAMQGVFFPSMKANLILTTYSQQLRITKAISLSNSSPKRRRNLTTSKRAFCGCLEPITRFTRRIPRF